MTSTARWAGLMAAAGRVAATASGAVAQRPGPDALENRAAAFAQSRADFARAAATFRKAAALRTAEDAQAVTDLRLAGLLYADVGDLSRAAVAREGAGERALGQGDFGAAAEAYTNAAFIVAQEGGAERAAVLAHRALWLAEQAGVSAGQRALVRQRLRSAAT